MKAANMFVRYYLTTMYFISEYMQLQIKLSFKTAASFLRVAKTNKNLQFHTGLNVYVKYTCRWGLNYIKVQ